MAESLPTSPKLTRRRSMDEPTSLSSSSVCLTEELQCCICLDVFSDPVTTPCGHNFCRICLKQCWDNSQIYSCPYCKETFSKRPELNINTTLRQITLIFKERFSLRRSKVLCDVCDKRKLKALKSCLMCQTSYCKTHLDLHEKKSLKKHKLLDPVENIKDYICKKHKKPLELFCRDDQTCVCVFCTDGDHKNHNTVPLEEESKEKKTQLMKTQTDIQQMIQKRIKGIQDIKHSAELRKKSREQEKAESVELFKDMIRSIERCQTELLETMEEEEKQDEDLINNLEQEIAVLKRRDSELEEMTHSEDHLHLIQSWSSYIRTSDIMNKSDISTKTHVGVKTLKRARAQLQETLSEKLAENVSLRYSADDTEENQEDSRHQTLSRTQKMDATLDSDTAYPKLILSEDRKQVRTGDIQHELPDNPERFDRGICVLGKEGFTSGRFYFEVQVKDKTNWDLGVARESIKRKGSITLTPEDGFWTVALRKEKDYFACTEPCVSLSVKVKPQTVGVCVDYEEGLVCFYDVESRSHICSFFGQTFTEKLFPYFGPGLNDEGKNSAPLIISPILFKTNEFTSEI
ncbi:E3 ubiquitin-protein ligase TRIM39-like [Paramisgurnus dabryanus]|uniref:E3 ubiquitin-protein ligase TRIM39-like n=1 Tax=Paramisgurnus dabryanus TaxID=90735 RepID=UPI003CCF83D2